MIEKKPPPTFAAHRSTRHGEEYEEHDGANAHGRLSVARLGQVQGRRAICSEQAEPLVLGDVHGHLAMAQGLDTGWRGGVLCAHPRPWGALLLLLPMLQQFLLVMQFLLLIF